MAIINRFNFVISEHVYCTEPTNETDTIEFDSCMERVKEKARDERIKKVWFWIMLALGVFFITFISKQFVFYFTIILFQWSSHCNSQICFFYSFRNLGILYYFHRRNANDAALLEKKSTKLRHIHQTSNGNVEVLLPQWKWQMKLLNI